MGSYECRPDASHVVTSETLWPGVGPHQGVPLNCCTVLGFWQPGRRRPSPRGICARWQNDRHCRLVVDGVCRNAAISDVTSWSSRRFSRDSPATVNEVTAQEPRITGQHTHRHLPPWVRNTSVATKHKHVLAAVHGVVQIYRHEARERVLHPNALQIHRRTPMP